MIHAQVLIVQAQVPLEGQSDAIEKSMRQSLPKEFPPVDSDITPQQVVDSGNLLGSHFLKKRYQEDGLMAHARLNDGSVLIFRGKDQNGRMVLLRLSNPQSTKNKDEKMKISLTLSYIEKPLQPDAFQLKEHDF